VATLHENLENDSKRTAGNEMTQFAYRHATWKTKQIHKVSKTD